MRKSHFGNIAFGGYSLNILLALLSSGSGKRHPSVTEMATLGNMSPTTGLRWIEVLHDKGFIKIAHNDDDPRGKSIMLTQRGKADMDSYLGSVAKMRKLALV
ncbi:hypothetical protein [Parasphingorhabdus sp.]|uniref:hypothetical protein n=1 Tax=Parasphingorhabdus sp. TaxID=2709688 RepID=UPI003298B940